VDRFKGDRLPVDDHPLTDEERRRARIPARFVTRQQHRDFMRGYMARRRAAQRFGKMPEHNGAEQGSAKQIARSNAASASHARHRPGYCDLCGHAAPVEGCPVCYQEQQGAPITGAAWEVMLATVTA